MRGILHCSIDLRLSLLALLLASVGAILAPAPALAGNRVWTGNSPRAKSIEAITRDPLDPARAWATAFGSGVFRTTDGGATWTDSRSGLTNLFVRCLAVQPRHPDSVYCGTNDGISLSVNGGLTWKTLLATNVSVRSITIHPNRTGTLYAGTYGSGIYKSINAGATWTAINLGLLNTDVRDVVLNPSKPETLLAATGTGGGVHRSFNGGLTWSPAPDTTATRGAAEQIQWDRQNPLRIYVATLDRGVLRSVDGGNTWARINTGLTTLRCRSLAVVDTLRYVGTDGQGVFVTTLNDLSWHPASAGMTNLVVDALSATGQGCWAGTDGGGIMATLDRGASWTPLDGGLLNTFGFSLAVRPSSHRIYAGMGFGDQFWSSGDDGATWARAATLVPHDSEHGVVPDPIAPSTVYLSAYGSGVYRSDDDGITWLKPDFGSTLSNVFVRDLVAWPGIAGHLYVGSGDGIFESTDSASHWTSRRGNMPASVSVRALALVPGNPPTLFVGGDTTGVWRTTNGGVNWAQRNTGLPLLPGLFIHALVVDAVNPLTVFAATDSGVYKSTNSGDAWVRASSGLPLGRATAMIQVQANPRVLFCAVDLAGVFESQDGGLSWNALLGQRGLTDLHIRSLAVDGARHTLYAGSDNGVAVLSGYPDGTLHVAEVPSPGVALSAWPSPVREGTVKLRLSLPRQVHVMAAVFDVSGARIRTLGEPLRQDGAREWRWDRRDQTGARVGPGVYYLRVAGEGIAETRAVVVLDR